MKWIGTDQGKEIVEIDGVTKAVDRAEFLELFPEHAPQAEATEEPAAEEVAEEAEATEAEEAQTNEAEAVADANDQSEAPAEAEKPKKGKTQ